VAGLAAVAAPTTANAGPLALCRAINSSTCMEGARPLPTAHELAWWPLGPPQWGQGVDRLSRAYPGKTQGPL